VTSNFLAAYCCQAVSGVAIGVLTVRRTSFTAFVTPSFLATSNCLVPVALHHASRSGSNFLVLAVRPPMTGTKSFTDSRFLERIIQTGKQRKVMVIRGITLEAYIAFLQVNPRFNKVPTVKRLLEGAGTGNVNSDMLKAVSDCIELTEEDGEYMKKGS